MVSRFYSDGYKKSGRVLFQLFSQPALKLQVTNIQHNITNYNKNGKIINKIVPICIVVAVRCEALLPLYFFAEPFA